MKITKENEDFIEELLSETGFEIWNASCTLRLNCVSARNKRFAVCNYDNPLHPVKEYDKLLSAINYLNNND